MNNSRRKAIRKLIEDLQPLALEAETIQEEEQEYIDSMPENLQQSERAYTAEEAVSNLEEAYDNLTDAITALEAACE